jgi:hypothetical protein
VTRRVDAYGAVRGGWMGTHASYARMTRPDPAPIGSGRPDPKEVDIAATIGPSAATHTEATSRALLAAAHPSDLRPA